MKLHKHIQKIFKYQIRVKKFNKNSKTNQPQRATILNEEFECQINDFIDIDKEQFHVENEQNHIFMAVS